MAKRSIVVDRWNGGLSSSLKEGRTGSYSFGRSLLTHEDSSYAKILPRTTKESSTTVTGLIMDMCRVPDGTIYAIDSDKKFYKRVVAGTWSVIATISGDTNGMGIFYWAAKDTIYITTDQSVSTYGPIGGTPALSENKYDTFNDQSISIAGSSSYPQSSNLQGRWSLDELTIAYPQRDNIQGLWHLNETSGSRADYSGNANTLTDNATVTSDATDAKEGGVSAVFEADNSEYLSSVDTASLSITGDLSFACWVKLQSAPSNASMTFLNKRKASGGDLFSYLFLYNDSSGTKTLQLLISDDGSTETNKSVTQTLNVDTWYHLAVVYDASAGEADFYVDGSAVGATQTGLPNSIHDNASGFTLGAADASNPGNFLDGKMDDAVLYDVELSSAEVSTLHGEYPLAAASTKLDATSNSNDLKPIREPQLSTTSAKEGTGFADIELDNSEYMTIADGDHTGLDIAGALTLGCWFKMETGSIEQTIIGKWETSSDDRQYRLYINTSDQVVLAVSSDGTSGNVTEATGGTTLNTGTWYHLTGTYTPSTKMEVFVDAVSDGSNSTTIPASIENTGGGDFTLGADSATSTATNFADGTMDNPFIYNTVLTTDEISTLKNSASGYVPLTAISETAYNTFSFVPDYDPQVDVKIDITNVGSGDWTITIHDDDNNVVTSKAIVNASLAAGSNTFTFASNWRPVLGATYHFHITSTVADGSVTSGNATTTAARLVDPVSSVHPIEEFLNFIVIGNERYLCTYDGLRSEATTNDGLPSSWTPHSIVLPSGYEVTCLARFDEYLVAGAEYRGTNIDDFSQGLLIFWDGTSPDFNFFLQVDEGGVSWLLPIKNKLYFGAGLRGEIFMYAESQYTKLKRLPKMTDKTYLKSLFSSVTIYQGAPLFGYGFVTDSTVFEHGVYSYTSKESPYNDVWTYDYPTSATNSTGATVKIGAVKAYGTDLLIAWRDGATYGVDVVTPAASPFTSAVYESLIYDGDYPYMKKFIGVIRVDHQALLANESVQISYKIDQASSWTDGTANAVDGTTETRLPVNEEFKDLQVKLTLAATTTSPQLNQLTFDIEDDSEQSDAI